MSSCYQGFSSSWLEYPLKFISLWGDAVLVPVGIVCALALYLAYKKQYLLSLIIIGATIVGNIIKSVLKNYYRIGRPSNSGCTALVNEPGYSFPSGHTIFYVVLFGFLIWYASKYLKKRWSRLTVLFFSAIMIISIGYSRVYLGAHWWRDVWFGYAIGILVLVPTLIMAEYAKRRYDGKG